VEEDQETAEEDPLFLPFEEAVNQRLRNLGSRWRAMFTAFCPPTIIFAVRSYSETSFKVETVKSGWP
jgi:hypothetical protein